MTKIFTWDWKEQAPLDAIAAAVEEVGQGVVGLREVPDTGGDLYACVVADHPLTEEEAQAIYDEPDEEVM
jgi:hypothetical protein